MHAVGVVHSKLSRWPPLEYKYRAVRYKDKSDKGNTEGFPLLQRHEGGMVSTEFSRRRAPR